MQVSSSLYRLLQNTDHRHDICLQKMFLLFKCSERSTKELFVSPANSTLVGMLITIADTAVIFCSS